MQPIMSTVVEAARDKFGEVMSVSKTGDNEYFVVCKRNDSPFKERPYMTITANTHSSVYDKTAVAFYWGHYDLDIEQVHLAIEKHRIAA